MDAHRHRGKRVVLFPRACRSVVTAAILRAGALGAGGALGSGGTTGTGGGAGVADAAAAGGSQGSDASEPLEAGSDAIDARVDGVDTHD